MHDFYIAHPSIKRSPIAGDVLKLKQPDGSFAPTAKLLSEISLTDVYLDFVKEHPEVKIGERSFRYLKPVELRRMKMRHLEMCGCRYKLPARPPSHVARTRPPSHVPALPPRPAHLAHARPRLCRWCVEMRYAQDALNAARAKLTELHPTYRQAAEHAKPPWPSLLPCARRSRACGAPAGVGLGLGGELYVDL